MATLKFSSGNKWAESIIDWSVETEKMTDEILKEVSYIIFSEIIDRTPVWFIFEPDSGTAKWNWQCSLDSPIMSMRTGVDRDGRNTKNEAYHVIERFNGSVNTSIYLANSVPYINILEDGGFPKTVDSGSYNRITGRMEVRSTGGYSKQAPNGMVKVVSTVFSTIVAEVARTKGFN